MPTFTAIYGLSCGCGFFDLGLGGVAGEGGFVAGALLFASPGFFTVGLGAAEFGVAGLGEGGFAAPGAVWSGCAGLGSAGAAALPGVNLSGRCDGRILGTTAM